MMTNKKWKKLKKTKVLKKMNSLKEDEGTEKRKTNKLH
jgi:hypothetical protein